MTPMQKAAKDVLAYFESGNSVPVDKVTLRADCAEVVALRAALAASEQEPVGIVAETTYKDWPREPGVAYVDWIDDAPPVGTHLYTAPQTPAQGVAPCVPDGWLVRTHSDGLIDINAPNPKPGESRRTCCVIQTTDRSDLADIMRKYFAHALAVPVQEPAAKVIWPSASALPSIEWLVGSATMVAGMHLYASPPRAELNVPPGYAIVPVKPPESALDAARAYRNATVYDVAHVWHAILTALPDAEA